MLLEAEGLCIAYGDATAIWDASLQVAEGEIVSVIGPNGAGKSTLINAIGGLHPWRSGSLRFDGRDMGSVKAHDFCRAGLVLVPEGRRLFTGMSVEENLQIGCYHGKARQHGVANLERIYDLFPILRERRRQPAGQLSGGQQQMVAIGRALMAEPRLLLMDEPSLGLAPVIVEEMFQIIGTIRTEGVSVLLVEQQVGQALEIADRAYVLEQGRIVTGGTPAELVRQPHIREAYLGI